MAGDRDLEMVIEDGGVSSFGAARESLRGGRLAPEERRSLLLDAVRRNALPRLLAARVARGLYARSQSRIEPSDIGALLEQIVSPDYHVLEGMVAILGMRGVDREDLLLNLLTPVARLLHEQWVSDEASFADVTLAVGRLQRLLRSSSLPQPSPGYGPSCGSILISPPPGEVHAFGSAVLADFFQNAQWNADRILPCCEDELAERVAGQPFDVLALSISQDIHLQSAARLIRRLRRCSFNSQLMVMIGGAKLRDDPGLWKRLGADASAPDAALAVTIANTWLSAGARGSRLRP